jgi:hypothetical protein
MYKGGSLMVLHRSMLPVSIVQAQASSTVGKSADLIISGLKIAVLAGGFPRYSEVQQL